jgi:hypothetical protein
MLKNTGGKASPRSPVVAKSQLKMEMARPGENGPSSINQHRRLDKVFTKRSSARTFPVRPRLRRAVLARIAASVWPVGLWRDMQRPAARPSRKALTCYRGRCTKQGSGGACPDSDRQFFLDGRSGRCDIRCFFACKSGTRRGFYRAKRCFFVSFGALRASSGPCNGS